MKPGRKAASGRESGKEVTMRVSYIVGVLALAAGAGVTQGRQQQPPQTNQETAEAAKSVANPHYAITDEDKARKNPVDFTEVTVERGKKLFESQCAMCHGEKADGKGDRRSRNESQPAKFHQARHAKGPDGRGAVQNHQPGESCDAGAG